MTFERKFTYEMIDYLKSEIVPNFKEWSAREKRESHKKFLDKFEVSDGFINYAAYEARVGNERRKIYGKIRKSPVPKVDITELADDTRKFLNNLFEGVQEKICSRIEESTMHISKIKLEHKSLQREVEHLKFQIEDYKAELDSKTRELARYKKEEINERSRRGLTINY